MLRVRKRWRLQREGDRDTHVGFSEILFSRSRKPFGEKGEKTDKRSETQTTKKLQILHGE